MTELISAPAFEALGDCQELTFTVDGANAELELVEIDTSPDVTEEWERFTLVFRGDRGALPSGTHRLVHEKQDPFDVFLSPTPTLEADSGEIHYDAEFTRRAPERTASELRGVSESAETDRVGLSAEPVLAGVDLFAANFAPRGFSLCQGQPVQVSQQNALFALLGTTYGGDGHTVFNLPDLRGRSPVGTGQGAGRSEYSIGDTGGTETVSLTTAEMAAHTHGLSADLPVSRSQADSRSPNGALLAQQPSGSDGVDIYATGGTGGSMAVEGTIAQRGGGQPHDNMAPYLALNYVIAMQGIFPSRN